MRPPKQTALALLLEAIGNEPLPKAGDVAHVHLAHRLGRTGWTVWGEIQAPLDREARIDAVVRRDGLPIALEIDRGRLKRSTLEKLAVAPAHLRLAAQQPPCRSLPQARRTGRAATPDLRACTGRTHAAVYWNGSGTAHAETFDNIAVHVPEGIPSHERLALRPDVLERFAIHGHDLECSLL